MTEGGESSKKQRSGVKRLPPNAGKGRRKGVPNRITRTVRQAIEVAFENVGGQEWLEELARTDPRTFVVLLAKIIPNEIKAEVSGPDHKIVITSGHFIVRDNPAEIEQVIIAPPLPPALPPRRGLPAFGQVMSPPPP